jgi:hypothetical protein
MSEPPEGHASLGAALLSLEVGTADHLARRFGYVTVGGSDPLRRGGLVLQAAHTALREAGVTGLPDIAREEVASGLGGPIREAMAAYWVSIPTTIEEARSRGRDEYLHGLTDAMLTQLGGGTGLASALTVASRVHLARAVRGTVPFLIGAACLSWYGAYLTSGSPIDEVFRRAGNLVEEWERTPDARAEIEARMATLAREQVGDSPQDLLDVRV